MSRVAFAVTELAPFTSGGAGVLVAEIADRLRSRGDVVTCVIAADPDSAETFAGDPSVVLARPVEAPGWTFPFMDTSMSVAEELSRLHREDPFDVVEFQDFDGLAFWMLTHRRDLGFGDTPLVVRFHGPVDLQIEAMGKSTPELDVVAAMERESFRMADRVIVPSPAIGRLVADRYGVAPDRIAVGAPVVRDLAPGVTWTGEGTDLLVIGRLSEVKGSHDMVRAAIPILERAPQVTLTFVGADGWSITANEPMQSWLSGMIPRTLTSRVRFLGHVPPEEIARLVGESLAVVVPSRFESFNLAAHEARRIGAPLIVPDLPAFEDVFNETTGALVFDGSVSGLSRAIDELVADPNRAREVARNGVPSIPDPIAVYGTDAEVRHERSQGGVATAALARVEAVRFQEPEPTSTQRMIRAAVGVMPTRMVRVLKSLIPPGLRRRIRDSADWDGVQRQRAWEDHWDALVRDQRARGALAHPRTTVIIPCYNHGAFVRQAVMSVFEQTDTNVDIIIVNDGSTDPETIEVLRKIKVPSVRVLHQENRGLPAARNAGIAATDAEFIVTLDADDILKPTYIEVLGDALRNDPTAGYAHCWAELFGDLEAVWATRRDNPYQLMMTNSVVQCSVVRREAWASIGGYDESMRSGNEDWDIWLRMGANGWHGVHVRQPLVRYRKHGVSMSVETESEYEDTLAALTTRLADVYSRANVTEIKRRWYPLVTVLCAQPSATFIDSTGPDVQHIETNEIEEVVDEIVGKYVVVLDDHRLGEGAILEMCRVLEENPDLGSVTTAGSSPVRVVRTWSLRDPRGPGADRIIDLQGYSVRRLEPHSHPSPEWSVPDSIDGLAVQRQHPEEAGWIPDWVPL